MHEPPISLLKSQLWSFRVNPHETDPSVDQAQDQTVQAFKRLRTEMGIGSLDELVKLMI